MSFAAPLNDITFALRHITDLDRLAGLEGLEADPETLEAAIAEMGRVCSEVLAPLNTVGDTTGAVLENGVVRTPPGFKEAYGEYRDGGWNSVPFDPAYGGMGLPVLAGVVMAEMLNSANMGFALCPLLNYGAVEAVHAHGSDQQKDLYLPKLISGEWTGTMNLTEPQAGSDVGALRSKAEPVGDGRWKIKGQKIFITYGEHDFAENIVHLVLARTPDSPSGTRGISLFLVPKYIPDADGNPGPRNDLRCIKLEHKLGIHASPTCVMSYGDNDECYGWMLGGENQGMRCMFTMMNNARLNVGVQGVAMAERATQAAVAYAQERRQGRGPRGGADSVAIVEHADVRRMLMTMKAYTEASRALCYVNAEAIDLARNSADEAERARFAALVELLTPVSKAWSTDIGCEVSSLGVQVHGGMGFIEETGAAQHMRDARIAPIYEGTNGIQAMDLVMRKLPLAGGDVVRGLFAEMRGLDADLKAAGLASMAASLAGAIDALEQATESMFERLKAEPNAAAAGAAPYLRMFGQTVGGYLLARGAVAAVAKLATGAGEEKEFLEAKLATARFYAHQLLPLVHGLLPAATGAEEELYAIAPERLSA